MPAPPTLIMEITKNNLIHAKITQKELTCPNLYWAYSRFMTMVADFLTGLEMLLFCASQVRRAPLSLRPSIGRTALEVTVTPEETSEASDSGRPLRYQRTLGFGVPANRKRRRFVNKCKRTPT